MRNPEEYYKLVNHLNIKSSKKHVGFPCHLNKLKFDYGGWIFNTIIEDSSPFKSIINTLTEENLLE
jgi:hypothetical protein